MDALVQQLSGLLLKAIPTIVLLIFVHFYLKYVFFKPLHEVLRKRREVTEGALEAAEKSLKLAAEKATMYDLALKEARTEVYRQQEETRRTWLDQQAARIDEVRHQTHSMIQDAGHKLDAEIVEARQDLGSRSQMLAMQIAESLSEGRLK